MRYVCSSTILGMHSEVTTLSDQLVDVTKVLDAVQHRLPFTVNRDELGDAMCDVMQLTHRVQALAAQVALAATNHRVAADAGQRTVGQFVAARTNSRARDVDRLKRTAVWLQDFPLFADAFGHELTDAHIQYMRKTLDKTYDTRVALKGDQEFFVTTAASCSYDGFVKACDYWLVHIDPDGEEPKDQIESSRLSVYSRRGGRGLIEGSCDAISAQKIRTAVEHEAEKLRTQDKANDVHRSDAQRRMAALTSLVTRGFAREDGTFPAPLINIVMSQSVAEWARGVLASDIEPGDTVPVDAHHIDGRCELIDGTPIHPFLAMLALGDHGLDSAGQPNLRRYVMDAKSRAIDVSVNARSAPEWMRTTALIQTRGSCSTFGCDAPHHWMNIDHVQPVAHGGETHLDNVEPLCRPDNQHKAATPGLTAWRDRTPPPRRNPRRSQQHRGDPDDADDPDADSDHNQN